MADTKISALTAGTAVGTDRFPVAISPFGSGDNRYLTPDLLGTYFSKNTLAAGTITTSQPMTFTQTWNSGAVQFFGHSIDITDTASASTSQPFRVRVGGNTIFSLDKTGIVSTTANLQIIAGSSIVWAARGGISFDANGTMQFFTSGFASNVKLKIATTDLLEIRNNADNAYSFVKGMLRTDTNATTGLVAGVLSASTNASIVVYDGAGQAYRVPCII